MKKLCSYRGLMGFIYALIMLMPFSSVLLRCCYVTFNDNANLSYAGTTETQVVDNVVNDSSIFDTNVLYYLKIVYSNVSSADIGGASNRIFVDNFTVIDNSSQYDLSNTIAIGFYQGNSRIISYYFWYGSNSGEYYSLSSPTNLFVSFNYVSNNLPTTTNVLSLKYSKH